LRWIGRANLRPAMSPITNSSRRFSWNFGRKASSTARRPRSNTVLA